MRFDDGIAIVSLESACVMHFSQAEPTGTVLDTGHLKKGDREPTKIPVYLNPGSLVVMSGDARYLWKHEINRKPGVQQWDGRELEQHRRTSVTLRKLLASPS
jgi:alkylated DNA repair dioxygenase AlkB